jgi:hypothetical protein
VRPARDRRAGLTFDEAWADCVEYVLGCVPDEEREGWAEVFEETRIAWGAAWLRSPVRAALTLDLLDGRGRVEIHGRCTLVA